MASKPSTSRQHKHFAVLIDADNAPAAIVEGLFEEIAKYGVASVKRIYGDWTQPNLGSWKKVLLDHSIQPIQQFAYTKGKNATDSSLIIDAMDLLYTRRFEGFCLVSSDSDFTRLAARIREEGLEVIGFGEQKTPKPFVSACDKFIYTELLRNDAPSAESEAPTNDVSAAPSPSATTPESKPAAQPAPSKVKPLKVPVDFIAKVIDDNSDEDGWCHLGLLGSNISKLRSDFDSRMYGFKKLSDLIKAQNGRFELQVLGATTTGGQSLAVRNRKQSK
ncbi:NYN domain protein [Pseudomonas sp. THAF187a]|uniref:NYN domain-containing protein n=1 Tax=Pseudomonadaceae TaxID=135621 RepID=UPI001267EA6F|nr:MULTISPECIES: NYN domain-containing protein [Pseudomonas]QFT23777.1 NYN domain protein [Pseudomonas sp. THAF187a]QFT43965.1 NYN domain protein [Pseudomonas sp. THAF42]QTS85661.1 NYN domain-containing protein [Pseudomonas khazarica]|tara:strand:+ start:317 stop:1144 length:828 start_codon:yes stop_codon:yes gene_type:complete